MSVVFWKVYLAPSKKRIVVMMDLLKMTIQAQTKH
jgi:hypothetical protein